MAGEAGAEGGAERAAGEDGAERAAQRDGAESNAVGHGFRHMSRRKRRDICQTPSPAAYVRRVPSAHKLIN
mgnify:CR=1 FL=1